MNEKWKQVYEIKEYLDTDDTLRICPYPIKKSTYAPNLGYRTWIFKYKDVYVALFDAGNGHYDYFSRVSFIDFIKAKLTRIWNKYF